MNTLLHTPSTIQHTIEEILGLNDMSAEEQQIFLANVGALIIESAVLKYVVGLDPVSLKQFDSWLTVNQQAETLLERSLIAYPDFAEVFAEEMGAFQSEALRLFAVTA